MEQKLRSHMRFFLRAIFGYVRSWRVKAFFWRALSLTGIQISVIDCCRGLRTDKPRCDDQKRELWAFNAGRQHQKLLCRIFSRRGSRGGGAGAGVHPWDGRTRAEGAGSLVSRAERRDTGVF